MIETIKKQWQNNPLPFILFAAGMVRLIAAIYSRGFAMSDDHFVIIHVAQRWLDGYNDWFNTDHPSGFSLVYTGVHYILFYLLKLTGITDPSLKMFIVRILHAVYSMLIVYFGYKITFLLSSKKNARMVGLLLALFWVLPFMSVRNLNEIVCIPPMIIAFYIGLSGDKESKPHYWIYAGIAFGLAFAIRYQTLLIPGGVGLVFLIQKEWQKSAYLILGLVSGLMVLQGVVDWIAWGYPFAAFLQYSVYNINYRFSYIIGPWYNYIFLILGLFIPPVSFYFVIGYFKTIKKYALLFWPVLLFLIFHSYFPNKQERFILPILPFLIIIGTIGWNEFFKNSAFWQKRKKLYHFSWIWFWIINTILMTTLMFTFSKKSMVEPMVYLGQKSDLEAYVADYNDDNMPWFPIYYLGKKIPYYRFNKDKSPADFLSEIHDPGKKFPNYIFFYGQDELQSRIDKMENLLKIKIQLEKKIDPSLIDRVMHTLNPRHNKNYTSYIYEVISNSNE